MKTKIWGLVLAIFLFQVSLGQAATTSTSHSVTITVPPRLEISSTHSHIELSFGSHQAGSETNAVTVNYTVKANSMSQPDGAPALSVQLDNEFDAMDFKASFQGFSSSGGNTELSAASSGFVTVENTGTVIANKANSSGSGKLLQGQFPIAYKAVANSELRSGDHTRQVTLTLTDI